MIFLLVAKIMTFLVGKKSSNITLVLTVTSKTVKIISNRQKNTLFRVVGR
jgi:hypothetical protein